MTLYYNLDGNTGAAININDRNPATGAVVDPVNDRAVFACEEGAPVFPCPGPPTCPIGGCAVDARHLLRNAADVLAERKAARFEAIDARTRDLIAAGFTYSGKVMSLSQNAQIAYAGMMVAAPMLTYPITLSCLDDFDGVVSLADASAVQAIYAAAVAGYAAPKVAGSLLKEQIRLAADLAALAAIVDTR